VALGLGGSAAFAAALYFGWQRSGGAADGYVIAGLLGSFALVGISAWIGFLFDENVSRPILSLASDLHARAASDVDADIDQTAGRYLGALAPAAGAIHDALTDARNENARSLAEKTARMTREKALLEALVRDLSQAVLVISPEKRILLFNAAAEALFDDIGLDRKLSRYMDISPLSGDAHSNATAQRSFLTSSMASGDLISGTMADFGTEEGLLGHVLVFEEATERLKSEAAADQLVAGLIDQVRRATMNIGALLDVIEADAAIETAKRAEGGIREEITTLAQLARAASSGDSDQPFRRWPSQQSTVGALFKALDPARATQPEAPESEARVHCDTYFYGSLIQTITALVAQDSERQALGWTARPSRDGPHELMLRWEGSTLPQDALDAVLRSSPWHAYGDCTVGEILSSHRADVWLAGRSAIALEVPQGAEAMATKTPQRPDFFNFAEFDSELGSKRLKDLSFVVFDTETTGLDVERDDVVQIAGVRILRGQLMQGDTFDELVDPGRPIPPSSTEIQGITDAMVTEARRFTAVGQAFSEFAENAVLVAHNASFDRAFLDRFDAAAEAPLFAPPMLCTAQLSLALNPHLNDHTLDAVADRYGVRIDDTHRHTALGDAEATAEVFLKMLPILSERSVNTLPEALAFQRPG